MPMIYDIEEFADDHLERLAEPMRRLAYHVSAESLEETARLAGEFDLSEADEVFLIQWLTGYLLKQNALAAEASEVEMLDFATEVVDGELLTRVESDGAHLERGLARLDALLSTIN